MQVVDSRIEDWEKERIFARAILCTQVLRTCLE
jgi:hypothetical protein